MATGVGLFACVAGLDGGPVLADSAAPAQELTLAECIALAMQNNRDLAAGRLGRQAQKLLLETAEDQFRPAPALNVAVEQAWSATELGRADTSAIRLSPTVTMRIPTGGAFSLHLDNRVTSEDTADQFIQLRFNQPLLKGGGMEVGTAGLVSARRRDRIGLLGFESAVTGLVTRTILAYRRVIRSVRAVEIARRSVQRAHDLLDVNRALIETGRMAEQDVVETEANVAERELSLTEAEGALDDARLALIDVLDIDSRTQFHLTESLEVEPAEVDVEHGVQVALENRPDYLQALLGVDNAETALAVAADAREWELNLTTSARFGHSGRSLEEAYSRFDDDYVVGLTLGVPLGVGAERLRRDYELAKIALRTSRLRVAELAQSIDVEVRGAVRDVEVQFRRAELAREARQLAERKLEVERIKLNSGLTTNFRLVRFEDDLVRSQNNEIGTVIAYLNARTALDRTLGTTLDTWQIEVEPPAGGGGYE